LKLHSLAKRQAALIVCRLSNLPQTELPDSSSNLCHK
jgi:hypothetical protein